MIRILGVALAFALSMPGLAANAEPARTPAQAKQGTRDLTPDALARSTGDELLRRIKLHQSEYKADSSKLYAMVDEVVLPHFDFNYMAKLVLARNWLDANDAQRARFEAAFRDLLVRTYGNALLQYSQETIDWQPMERQPEDDKVVVKSSIKSPGASAISMDYRMRRTDDGWKVYDISVDGISLVTNYRGTYNAEIRRNGMEALIKRLEDKAAG